MDRSILLVAKKIVQQMDLLTAKADIVPDLLPFYMGLGQALCFIYEVETGRTIVEYKLKAKEVIQWARDLK